MLGANAMSLLIRHLLGLTSLLYPSVKRLNDDVKSVETLHGISFSFSFVFCELPSTIDRQTLLCDLHNHGVGKALVINY